MVGNGWGVGGIAPSPEVMHRHPRACMPHCCALLICRSATTCITNTVSTTRAILAQFLRCGIEWQVATVELAWHIAQRLTAVLTCVRVRTRVFTRAVEAVYFNRVPYMHSSERSMGPNLSGGSRIARQRREESVKRSRRLAAGHAGVSRLLTNLRLSTRSSSHMRLPYIDPCGPQSANSMRTV